MSIEDLRPRTLEIEFTPQVWINDIALSVDPQGPTVFSVPEHEALYLTERSRIEDIDSRTFDSDELRHSNNAPDWIRQWSGPFEVDVIAIHNANEENTNDT